MLTGIMLLAGLVFAVYAAMLLMEGRSFIEAMTVGASSFFCGHVITGYVLFFLDVYSPLRLAAVLCFLAFAVLGVSMAAKKRLRPCCSTEIRGFIAPLLVILVFIGMVSVKNEYFGLGQDQGVYQTQTIGFLNGETGRIHEYDEYYDLDEGGRQAFFGEMAKLSGFDMRDYEGESPEFFIHGIPSFSALMTSWAEIFGMTGMQGIQTLFCCLVIMTGFLISRNLGMNTAYSTMVSVAVAISPIVIWVGKSALTEGFLAVAIALFLYLITGEGKQRYLSIVPVIAFSFYHISFFTTVPMFIAVYAMLFIASGDRRMAVLMVSMPVIELVSYFSMRTIEPIYTDNNYMKLMFFMGENAEASDVPAAVLIFSGICLALCLIIIPVALKLGKKGEGLKILRESMVFGIILRVLLAAPLLKCAWDILKKEGFTRAIYDSSIYQYLLAPGLILAVVAIVIIAVKPSRMLLSEGSVALSIMFFYMILVYCAFLRPDVPFFFYYSRYLMPYILIAVLFVMFVIKDRPKLFTVPLFTISMLIFVPADLNLVRNVDDTRIEWSTLQDIAEKIEPGSKVVIDDDAGLLLWAPVRSMTGAKVYPKSGDIREQALGLLSDSDVYVISRGRIYEDVDEMELIYHDDFIHVNDTNPAFVPLTRYPSEFSTSRDEIYLYRLSKTEVLSYPVGKYHDFYSGLGANERRFSWSVDEEVTLNCVLHDRDYTMTVTFDGGLPFANLDFDSYPIEVYVNDELIDTVRISGDQSSFRMDLNGDMLLEGDNKICFKSALWSASVLNPGDTRMIGYALRGVTFTSR